MGWETSTAVVVLRQTALTHVTDSQVASGSMEHTDMDRPADDGREATDDGEQATGPRLKAGLGIVMINFRTPRLVEACLESLGPQLDDSDARVVVVDNCSGDGSADEIADYLSKGDVAWKERVALIRSAVNTGFSGGNNIGLRHLDAPFYLLLNSDTLVRPGALEELKKAAGRHPRAGVVGVRLEDPDGTPQRSAFRYISPLSEFLAGAQLSLLDRLFSFAEVARPVSNTPVRTDWVSFACVLIRAAAIRKAGLMDEGYFMYFEDADYCRAISKAGYQVVYDPGPRIVHLRGGSSPVKKAISEGKRPPAYFYAARTRYFRKLYGPLGPALANIAWRLGRSLGFVKVLAGRDAPRACIDQGKDHWLNWRNPLGSSYAPTETPARKGATS